MQQHFPDAIPLREAEGDVMLCDRELSPHCGFVSMAEAEILKMVAEKHRGPWLELGSHVAWSAAWIASAGCSVVAVDPAYDRYSEAPGSFDAMGFLRRAVHQRAIANLGRAGLLDMVELVGMTSAEFFRSNTERFVGCFVDGDHSSPVPLQDAQAAAKVLLPGGVIVLHDAKGQPVKDAVAWLMGQGFVVTVHDTLNGLAVAVKG